MFTLRARFSLLLLSLLPCAAARAGADAVKFGDASSEKAHAVVADNSPAADGAAEASLAGTSGRPVPWRSTSFAIPISRIT